MSLKKTITYIIIAILAIFLLNVGSSAFYTVQENEYACVRRFSKIIDTVENAGIKVKVPFIDEVVYFPKTQLFYDMKQSEVLTLDSKNMTVDSFVVWRIVEPLKFYQTLGSTGTADSMLAAESRLDATVYSILKNVIGTTMRDDIISSADEQSRELLNNTIAEQVKGMVGSYGIEVIDVKVKRFELPTDNEQSVFRRMISDRNRIAELYIAEGAQEATMIRNEVDKSVNIIISNAETRAETIIAEGEAEYMRRLAEAYGDPDKREFYSFMRGLEAAKASLKNGETTLILDKDSTLAQILIRP